MTDSQSPQKPDWWKRNQQLRDELDLPTYEPPSFEDGIYKHEIVNTLENAYDCLITFRTKNPTHPCKWNVYVNGDQVATLERRRTNQGNTVFTFSSTKFENIVRSYLQNETEQNTDNIINHQ